MATKKLQILGDFGNDAEIAALTGTVTDHDSAINALESKVGDSAVSQQIANATADKISEAYIVSSTAPAIATNRGKYWINSGAGNAMYFNNGTSWVLVPAIWA